MESCFINNPTPICTFKYDKKEPELTIKIIDNFGNFGKASTIVDFKNNEL